MRWNNGSLKRSVEKWNDADLTGVFRLLLNHRRNTKVNRRLRWGFILALPPKKDPKTAHKWHSQFLLCSIKHHYITDMTPTKLLLRSFSVPATSLKGFTSPMSLSFLSNDTSFSTVLKQPAENQSVCAKKNASRKCQEDRALRCDFSVRAWTDAHVWSKELYLSERQ